ncbi:tRNA (adenosine(37)-N6)-dimethylallyltransferase MiaA [Aquaspirillum serpens]|uniref:tRNA (adenosine(37)-N6)-dimethylallyltransferase MiaA n=1 Tax=Aquaspirillum serpens TaxID=190 RepID=UPI0003B3F29E|nr:tRNA (adenosine(37)-N6)-dimethylallyltransferase MiaA [Aquaspirillum serpens]
MTSSIFPPVFLIGPTASGKTQLALHLAEHFPIEIISIDSALVYRDMDIGTAKPSQAEQAAVPHHLIDVISPLETYSAAAFHQDAMRLIHEIQQRGKLPLLVGGTMLYVKALCEGLSDLPPADPVLRQTLEQQAASDGWPAMHARLAVLDPVTAARLKPTDSQRIQRALEICLLTGQPMSAQLAARSAAPLADPKHFFALVPSDRHLLHQRIALRFEQMLTQGLLDEVTTLRKNYSTLHPDLPSMRCVGYRQAWQYLDGECSREEMVEKGIAATRQLAKRQLTWLRSMPNLTTLDCVAGDPFPMLLQQLQSLLAAECH